MKKTFRYSNILTDFLLSPVGAYIRHVGIAISILFNVLSGGEPNQSFSARNYGWKKKGYPNLVWLIDWAFFLDNQHCLTAWSYWFVRKDTALNYKNGDLQLREVMVYYQEFYE